MSTEGTVADIYDELCKGRSLTMAFSNQAELDAFRIKLHKYRKGIADTLQSIGEDTEKSSHMLTITQLGMPVGEAAMRRVRISLQPSRPTKFTYQIEE